MEADGITREAGSWLRSAHPLGPRGTWSLSSPNNDELSYVPASFQLPHALCSLSPCCMRALLLTVALPLATSGGRERAVRAEGGGNEPRAQPPKQTHFDRLTRARSCPSSVYMQLIERGLVNDPARPGCSGAGSADGELGFARAPRASLP